MANQFLVNIFTADGLPLAAGAVTGSLDLSVNLVRFLLSGALIPAVL